MRAAAPGGMTAGTSVRFEPGIEMQVELVAYAGAGGTAGFRGLYGPAAAAGNEPGGVT